jgi:putative salt-induced outer membrane protein YdiY
MLQLRLLQFIKEGIMTIHRFVCIALTLLSTQCLADNVVSESAPTPTTDYPKLAKEYQAKADYYKAIAGIYESAPQVLPGFTFSESTTKVKPFNNWSGTQLGLGGGAANGKTDSSNFSGSAIVNYRAESGNHGWVWKSIGQYDYLFTSTGGNEKNRAYLQQNGAYMYDKYNGVFGQASYLNDANGGFYYVWNENIGYQLQLLSTKLLQLQLSLGPGLQQRQLVVNNTTENLPQWLSQLTLNLNINDTLVFTEQLQNTATVQNTTTYSISALTLQVTKDFGIGINYQYTYNTNPPKGQVQTSTISSLQLTYGIN